MDFQRYKSERFHLQNAKETESSKYLNYLNHSEQFIFTCDVYFILFYFVLFILFYFILF